MDLKTKRKIVKALYNFLGLVLQEAGEAGIRLVKKSLEEWRAAKPVPTKGKSMDRKTSKQIHKKNVEQHPKTKNREPKSHRRSRKRKKSYA